MAADETNHPDDSSALPDDAADLEIGEDFESEGSADSQSEEKPEKLNLDVKIESRSTCERHITVTVPREDLNRYYDKEFSELVSSAHVPGFRPGHAPRRLVEARFRKEIGDKIKSAVLADSIGQLGEEQDLSPISEPEIDLDAVEVPDEGPMTFEFDLEVRPEFDLPQWKGLTVNRPVHEFTHEDIDEALQNVLARRGKLVPYDGPAASGDYITTNLTFTHGGQTLSSAKEEVIRIRPVLSFRDGTIDKFDELMAGVCAGETRQAEAQLSEEAPNAAIRGQKVQAAFEVLEVKKLELPELNAELLDSLGGFETEADLRDAIRDTLNRQLEYRQRQQAREQIASALTATATWDLPPDLLRRQSDRELERAVLELRSSGFSDEEIRAHANELRQNSRITTARALKEHFILERIAEEEAIEDPSERDYDQEIRLIASQSGETPRRVRAKLEKSGRLDVLRNQIIERRVIDLILSHAEFRDVAYKPERTQAEAVEMSAGGGDQAGIPEAKAGGGEPGQSGPAYPGQHVQGHPS
ncbi:MAG: trigger factor [Pirellulales bacterium]|nr:trigger factor [Pirellulales bacterium]